MSSFNNIRKVRYTQNPSEAVALTEYIIFADERAKRKYLVFKFQNNVNQQLLGMEFEVSQYDVDGELIEKSVAIYNQFLAKANEAFVPAAKLKINYECVTISVKLQSAAFDRVIWKDGEFSDNSYKFEHYSRDIAAERRLEELQKQMEKQEKQGKRNKEKPEKEKKKKKQPPYTIKDATRKNISPVPLLINILICIVVVAFIAGSLAYFRTSSQRFTAEGFDLHILDKDAKTAAVYGYETDETDIAIPANVSGYDIIRVEEGAFVNSNMQSVTFESNSLVVEGGAFKNCKSLTSVNSSEAMTEMAVMPDAFTGCTALQRIELPQAYLYENAFNGSVALQNIVFDETSALTCIDFFGGQHCGTINYIKFNAKTLSGGFFDGLTVKTLILNEDCKIEYGAYKNVSVEGYQAFESMELINGQVITLNTSCETLCIPSDAKEISIPTFSKELSSFTALKIDNLSALNNAELFSSLTNVNKLEFTSKNLVTLTKEDYSQLSALEEFVSPVLPYPLYIYLPDTVKKVGVTAGLIDSYYFRYLNNVTDITISINVTGVAGNAFLGMAKLRSLSIPDFNASFRLVDTYSGISSLEKIELLPTDSYAELKTGKFNGFTNLKEISVGAFKTCQEKIVSDCATLTKITFADGIDFNGFPVIGGGCTSLSTVSVSFNAYPKTYSAFNQSCEYTANLSVTFTGKVIPSGFISADCVKLNYLEVHAPAADDFKSEDFFDGSKSVETLIIDIPKLSQSN